MLPSLKNPPQDRDFQGPSLPQTHPSPFVVLSTDHSWQHQPPQQSPTRDHHAPPSYPVQNQQTSHHNHKPQLQPAPARVSPPQRDPWKVDNTQPTDQISQQQSLLLPKDNSQPSSYQSSDDYQRHNPPLPVRQQESPPSSQMSNFPQQPPHSFPEPHLGNDSHTPNYPDSQLNPVTGQPQVAGPVITAYPIERYNPPPQDHVPGNSPLDGYPPQAQPPQPPQNPPQPSGTPSLPPQKVCLCCNCF